MKKAIKLIAILSAFSLIVLLFSACSITFDNDEATTAATTVSDTTDNAEAIDATTEKETTTQQTDIVEASETIDDIFADIKNFQIGTAGSSKKAADLALRLIAFSASSLADADTLKDDIQALVATVDANNLNYYGETLYQINIYADKFFSGNVSEVVDLSDIDSFDTAKNYSKADYDKIYKLLSDY